MSDVETNSVVYVQKMGPTKGRTLGETERFLTNLNNLDGYDGICYFTERGVEKDRKDFKSVRKNQVSLIKELLFSKPDVVIVEHFYGGLFLLILELALLLSKTKIVVCTDMTLRRLHVKTHNPLKKLKSKFIRFLFFVEGYLADRIWCLTEREISILTDVLPIPKEKFVVIPLGRELEFKTEEKEPYFLGVSGWWSDIKNLHTALKVFKEVKEEVEGLKFFIVGEFHSSEYSIVDLETRARTDKSETGKEYKKRIEKLIQDLDLDEDVKFLGYKRGDELWELYRKAKIYYMPSKSEGFGKAFVEAMASGTPAVAMRDTAIDCIIEDGVTGFLRNDPEEQKEAILKLLKDDDLYEEMQENCLLEAEEYSWTNVLKKWKNLLQEM